MKLLSIAEVGAILGVSRWTVTEMLESGALPGFVLKTGRRKKLWRVNEERLQEWIRQKENETKRKADSRRLQAIV